MDFWHENSNIYFKVKHLNFRAKYEISTAS